MTNEEALDAAISAALAAYLAEASEAFGEVVKTNLFIERFLPPAIRAAWPIAVAHGRAQGHAAGYDLGYEEGQRDV